MRRWASPRCCAPLALLCILTGCFGNFRLHRRPHITARPASPQNACEPAGIPFYLPKPMLVVSKNFYHIEEAKVGLTDSAPIPHNFDAQAQYADANAGLSTSGRSDSVQPISGSEASKSAPTMHSPNGAPATPRDVRSDGLAPHMFFTYEIVFVPDLTQKYVLQVEGGPGEIRAAMNLVNGWQFTGLGPYYMKDSATAQNRIARGIGLNLGLQGAADVVNAVANLAAAAEGKPTQPISTSELQALAQAIDRASSQDEFDWFARSPQEWTERRIVRPDGTVEVVKAPPTIERYAEIYVYEPVLVDGSVTWQPIFEHGPSLYFDREYLGSARETKDLSGLSNVLGGAFSAAAGREVPTPVKDREPETLPGVRSDRPERVPRPGEEGGDQDQARPWSPGREPAEGQQGGGAGDRPSADDGAAGRAAGGMDSALVRDIINQTLATQSAEKPKGVLRWLHSHRRKDVNRTVNALTPPANQ